MQELKFDSVYAIKKAQIKALGGDATLPYDSVYEEELELLRLLEEGGGGGQGLKPPFEAKFNEDNNQYEMGIITSAPDENYEGAYLWTYEDELSKSAGFNADGPDGYAYIQTDGGGGGVMSVGRSDGYSTTILPNRIDLNTADETVFITLESVDNWNTAASLISDVNAALETIINGSTDPVAASLLNDILS